MPDMNRPPTAKDFVTGIADVSAGKVPPSARIVIQPVPTLA
jgi:hypothetical protein